MARLGEESSGGLSRALGISLFDNAQDDVSAEETVHLYRVTENLLILSCSRGQSLRGVEELLAV